MLRIARVLTVLCAITAPLISARAADKPRRIAIMPFQNLTGGKELDSIGTGIAETLITELGRIPDLTLVERSRLNEAQKEIKLGQSGAVEASTAQRMGKFLGADGVIVGSFQRSGNVLRVSARVIDVQTAQVRESTSVDGRLDDLLNLQDQLAAKLLEAMKGTLAAADRRRLGASPSTSVEALRAFSDGVFYYKLDLFQDAITSFDKAIALDPNYIDALYYEGLAFGKLKKWDDAIASFKRTLPRGAVEHTVKWSWDAPFDATSSRTGAFATLDPAAASTQNLLSPEAVVRARKRIVYAEISGGNTVYTLVDPVEHRSSRLEVPGAGLMFGLALASERVIALPGSLLENKMRLYGVSAADGTLLWQKDLETQSGLSLGGFAGETFWIYSPGERQLVGFDEMTLREKWRRDNIALDLAFPTVRPGAAGGAALAIARSAPERKLHAIRTSDGVDAWTVDLQSDQSFLLAAAQAVVVFEPDVRVFAVDADSGRPLLDIRIKQAPRMKSFGVLGSLVTVAALVQDATLYFASDLNEIVSIDTAPGTASARRQRWKTPPQKPIREIRAAGQRVYATTDAGELLVVDAQSGAVAAAKIGGQSLDLDYAGDDLVVVSSSEAVYGLKPENGARVWEFRAPARTKRPVYFKGTVLVETSGTSRLIALDADTGGVLWQFTTPLAGETLGDLGASAPKVMFGDDSVFLITPWGVREYGVNRSASQGISNKEALTDLAAAYVEKGDLDEAERFAEIVGREFDPSYPPLWRVRSRIAQARGKGADALRQLLTYVDLVGRESKAGQEVLADLKRTRGLLWTAEVGASFWRPLLADRKLVAHNVEQVLAVDPASGKTLWRVRGDRIYERVYDPRSRRLFYAETLARDRRTAVISTIDVVNGDRKEFGRVALPTDITGFVTAFAAGRLYLLGYAIGLDVQPQQIHVRVGAFDAASGRRLWEKPADLTLAQAMVLQQYGSLFFPLGDSVVCSIGREVLVLGGDDGAVRAQFTTDSDIKGRYLLTDQGSDPDLVYFGTVSTAVNGYSISAKQFVVRANPADTAGSSFAFDNVTVVRDGMMYDTGPGDRVFAFDVRKDTPDASRLKWRTNPDRDGRLFNIRFVGSDLFAARVDNTLVRIDPATGRILNEYPLLWSVNSVVEDGERQYGFTSDGLAFALQLKPISK